MSNRFEQISHWSPNVILVLKATYLLRRCCCCCCCYSEINTTNHLLFGWSAKKILKCVVISDIIIATRPMSVRLLSACLLCTGAPCDQVAATHSRVVVGHKVSINEIDDVDVLHSTNGGDPPWQFAWALLSQWTWQRGGGGGDMVSPDTQSCMSIDWHNRLDIGCKVEGDKYLLFPWSASFNLIPLIPRDDLICGDCSFQRLPCQQWTCAWIVQVTLRIDLQVIVTTKVNEWRG